MRSGPTQIWDRWLFGKDAVGADKPNAYVTIVPGWQLKSVDRDIPRIGGGGLYTKGPVRYWHWPDAIEETLPNLRRVEWNRSLETDAADCTIQMVNTRMDPNSGYLYGTGLDVGSPGAFSWARGTSVAGKARWGHDTSTWPKWIPYPSGSSFLGAGAVQVTIPTERAMFDFGRQLEGLGIGYALDTVAGFHIDYFPPPMWVGWLTPNSLLYTYEGYGGWEENPDTGQAQQIPVEDAIAAGNVAQTGVWLIDSVRPSSDGKLQIKARDLGKLLIEQHLYPPLVPFSQYPDGLRYYRYFDKDVITGASEPKSTVATAASSQDPNHPMGHATDLSKPETEWICASQSGAHNVQWIEIGNNGVIDTVILNLWGGNYHCYVSVSVAGIWVDPHTNAAPGGGPPFVADTGTPGDGRIAIPLGASYIPDKVRLTFDNLLHRPEGDYRCGLREYVAVTAIHSTQQTDGNMRDGTDVVQDFLLWSGFYDGGDVFELSNAVRGNLETTGWFPSDAITAENFDKNPVIDGITVMKEIVGYLFTVACDGDVNYRTPNWWESGNFYEDGSHTDFIPDIDERFQLSQYTVEFNDETARSEIIISTEDPAKDPANTTTSTRFTPPSAAVLKGIVRPMMWTNGVFTVKEEQEAMAALIAIHMWFAQRQGQVKVLGNPLLEPDDQVRIWERQTEETSCHYIRAIASVLDLASGDYSMTLTTHWLGEWPEPWAVEDMITQPLEDFLANFGSPRTARFRIGGGDTITLFPPGV